MIKNTFFPTGVRTIPAKRAPSRNVFTKPCLANFLPEHFFGSQCSKSHMATGKEMVDSSSDSAMKFE